MSVWEVVTVAPSAVREVSETDAVALVFVQRLDISHREHLGF